MCWYSRVRRGKGDRKSNTAPKREAPVPQKTMAIADDDDICVNGVTGKVKVMPLIIKLSQAD